MTENINHSNPLLLTSRLKNRAIPFPDIKPEHFLPALDKAIEEGRKRVHHLRDNPLPPDFGNTILALESCGDRIEWISAIFYNLLSAETNEELQALAAEVGPRLASFGSDIILDEKIFARVKTVWDRRAQENLNTEQLRLLENTYTDFVRNGALLNAEQKTELRELDQKLSRLGPQFNENVLKDTNSFEYWVRDRAGLSGLPDSAVEAAAMAAEEKGRKGEWLFSLQAPSFLPFLEYGEDRSAREKIWRAYNSRAFQSANDNQNVIRELVGLRHSRAQLLGFASHADFVLRKRMAESPEKVQQFLDKLLLAYKAAAEKELRELQDFARSLGHQDELRTWDIAFYSEKLKKRRFNYDEEELRPYFRLENVIAGVFEHARRLYQIEFRESKDYPVYHPDVKTYEVWTEGPNAEYVGLFYADFFPRATKRAGAWMTNYYEQGYYFGEMMRPHVAIVCNFTKPTPTKPSLLSFDEVRTLFHEFGHSLHSLLSRCHYRSISGTNVYWDFVELPSQIFENWTLEKESLDLFAKHYQTGAPIPAELTAKIKAASQFMAGWSGLRQVSFARLDMAWHSQNLDPAMDVPSFEAKATEATRLLSLVAGTNSSCGFSHIFGGGYSAGYYSYKWAEVLDADAFEFFKERGLFNKEVARRFKDNILSRGGSEHPMELYKKFRGREPDPIALFRRDGLVGA